MKLCSIASGSSGNCIYVGNTDTHLLVDTGISKKRIEESLEKLGVAGNELHGILVTHEHSDHIQGLGVFCRKYHIPIYATKGTIQGILQCKTVGDVPEKLFREIKSDMEYTLGSMCIKPFAISHDANQPTGFRIEDGEKKVAIATDLGQYDDYIIGKLKQLDAIVLEANHDTHMLEVGPYPYYLKQRVLGCQGHLSNELSGRLLCQILHPNLKHIILGHLSRENNFPELAYETVKLEVTMSDVPFDGNQLPLMVADRDKMSKIIQV